MARIGVNRMSEEIEITLPKLGESVVKATIVQWFKGEGDLVEEDEPLVEVSTDKVNSEIPSPVGGKITKILAHQGEELDVGKPLAWIMTTQGSHEMMQPSSSPASPPPSPSMSSSKQGLFSPVVMKIAQERGLPISELKRIPTTGAGNRLSKRDLETYLKKKENFMKETQIPLTPMRKTMAAMMMRSVHEAPQVTLVSEVDLSKVLQLISEKKCCFKSTHGCNLTITSFTVSAMVKAIKDFPLINASIEKENIVIKEVVNLGFAVSVDQGVLLPILFNCQTFSLKEIATEIAKLSDQARSNALSPDQFQGGTISMTNFGMGGALLGTPIVRYGQAAIIAIGAIKKRLVVLEDDTTAIRSMAYLTLTFDHRIFDGMYGCRYLEALKSHLESDIALT